jgi:hypothetical protein
MVCPVNRRLSRRWIHLLVAAQILVSAPMASAFAAIASAGQDDHCAEMMGSGHGENPAMGDTCACCPDGASGVAGCLSACTASLGAIAVFSFASLPAVPVRVAQEPHLQRVLAAEPPIKPPPIY